MILTAHQPVYLPWLGLFHKIALAEKFVFFNEVQYLPKDWMNRNKIKTPSGEIWLTVPVLRKGHRGMKTSEIKINNDIDWKRKHLNSIRLNYKKSLYFKKYFPFTEFPLNGNLYYTDPTYYWYKKNLLEIIEKVPNVRTYNCTDGGTLVEDKIILVSLNDFLSKYKIKRD